MLSNEMDLLYVAPERLMTPGFLRCLERMEVSLFAIDEAHCVSSWGHDFRVDYLGLHVLADKPMCIDPEGYETLREAFERLAGTRITTNIATGETETTTGFGLIDSWEIVRRTRNAMQNAGQAPTFRNRSPSDCRS